MTQKRVVRPIGMFLCVIGISLLALMDQGVGYAKGDPAMLSKPAPLPTLTLRDALSAAVDNNPDVQLYKERIEAAQGQVQTQLGAMLPNLSSTVRQTRQTQFLGTFGLSPTATDPFSIFDARVNASQNLVSLSLI
jgi:outer membrane protein TolC